MRHDSCPYHPNRCADEVSKEKCCQAGHQHVYRAPGWTTYFEGTNPRNAVDQSTFNFDTTMTMHIRTARTWAMRKFHHQCRQISRKFALTSPAIRSSNIRTGVPRRGSRIASKNKTSTAVINTPCHNFSLGKRSTSAMAEPSISARSVAMIATSDSRYKGYKHPHRNSRVYLGLS